ncbi:phage holin family protein [Lysobacter koreensis]|uniref:Phage holin family protein n=1 Tax=Lysobacter koreensis TaxID=266122 RepID=A0ABW2YLY5_9GAMM
MSDAGGEREPPTGPGPIPGPVPDPAPAPPPDLGESLRDVAAAGRAGLGAAGDAAKAFRTLLSADISLARSAFGRTLALTGVAIAFGASAWLLLMAALIVFLSRTLAWPWTVSLLVTALLSLAITVFAGWQSMRYFEHTRLQATRRQLARLGIGELADFTPEPGSPASTREVTENAPPVTRDGEPVKGEQGIDVTPP